MNKLSGALTLVMTTPWTTDPEKGINIGKQRGYIVIFYFYSEECPYCYHMETFVLGDKDIENYTKNKFVFVSIDYDEDEEWSEKFNVRGTPTFVFYDPIKEKVIGTIFGSREKEDFLNILRDMCIKSKLLRRC